MAVKNERHTHASQIVAREQPREGTLHDSRSRPPGIGSSGVKLTAREQVVLRLMADGLASKQIADELKISVNTVNNHREAILKKLDVHSATAATKWYWAGTTN